MPTSTRQVHRGVAVLGLRVDVIRACGLLAADLNGKSDPYVTVHCHGQKRKTRIIKRTLEPEWDETVARACGGRLSAAADSWTVDHLLR